MTEKAEALDPTAVATAADVTDAGVSYSFTVRYVDDGEVDTYSIDSNDVRVNGPAGFDVAATFVDFDHNAAYSRVTATYSIVPPGGSWDSADNGTYNIVMQPSQVFDGLGNPVKAGNIGQFSVSAPLRHRHPGRLPRWGTFRPAYVWKPATMC